MTSPGSPPSGGRSKGDPFAQLRPIRLNVRGACGECGDVASLHRNGWGPVAVCLDCWEQLREAHAPPPPPPPPVPPYLQALLQPSPERDAATAHLRHCNVCRPAALIYSARLMLLLVTEPDPPAPPLVDDQLCDDGRRLIAAYRATGTP